jgi:hypothetical protein
VDAEPDDHLVEAVDAAVVPEVDDLVVGEPLQDGAVPTEPPVVVLEHHSPANRCARHGGRRADGGIWGVVVGGAPRRGGGRADAGAPGSTSAGGERSCARVRRRQLGGSSSSGGRP